MNQCTSTGEGVKGLNITLHYIKRSLMSELIAQWCVRCEDHLTGKAGEQTTVTEAWTYKYPIAGYLTSRIL